MPLIIAESIPLAPLTTLGLGGSARFFAEIREASDVAPAIAWARQKDVPVFVLGGGSNLVVADEGFAGLVLRIRTAGRRWSEDGAELRVEVEAGENWDDVVAEAVGRGAAGIECLAGIPGSAGAAPVQNIGAYGQEVASAARRVSVLDRQSLDVRELDCDACGFDYRDSIFKRDPDRFVILSVTLGLSKNAPAIPRYPELAASLVAKPRPGLTDIREAVLALRRKKSMVLDEVDPNHRSAGSFFTNPIVTAEIAAEVAARAGEEMPCFPLPDGRVKLAAGWLIEHSGLEKGFRMGPVGISSRHALALVHHGGGTTKDLLRLAQHARKTVLDRFGISLAPEPVFLGPGWPCTSVPLGAL